MLNYLIMISNCSMIHVSLLLLLSWLCHLPWTIEFLLLWILSSIQHLHMSVLHLLWKTFQTSPFWLWKILLVRADEWNVNKWDWEGSLKVVSKGDECIIRLEDKTTGAAYLGACQVEKNGNIVLFFWLSDVWIRGAIC